jgi:hypothetical protein
LSGEIENRLMGYANVVIKRPTTPSLEYKRQSIE